MKISGALEKSQNNFLNMATLKNQDQDPAVPKTLSVEEVLPFYLEDRLAVLVPNTRLYRIDGADDRYYYTEAPDGTPTFFLSVTSMLSRCMPESRELTDWRVRLGKEESEDAANVAASYGTFLHALIAEFLKSGIYRHEATFALLAEHMQWDGIPQKYFNPWLRDIASDMVAFAQWVYEYKVEPLAIEYPLFSLEDGIAGTVDLVHRMKGVSGCCITDFKSGRKGFYPTHEAQGHTYRMLWNQFFSGTRYEVERVFNWAPKNWQLNGPGIPVHPSYKFVDQTKSPEADRLAHYLALYKTTGLQNPGFTFLNITGDLELGASPEGRYVSRDLAELFALKKTSNANR